MYKRQVEAWAIFALKVEGYDLSLVLCCHADEAGEPLGIVYLAFAIHTAAEASRKGKYLLVALKGFIDQFDRLACLLTIFSCRLYTSAYKFFKCFLCLGCLA